MIEYYILCSSIVLLLIIIIIFATRQQCLIDDSLYPELHIFKPNNDLIYDELKYALKEVAWTDQSNINKNLKESMEPLFTRKSTVKYFIFIKDSTIVNNNINTCPNITTLINAVPNVVFAAIMCIKGNYVSDNISFLKNKHMCFIPISQSNDEFGLIINNYIYKYSDLLKNIQFLIVNSDCVVQVYNQSMNDRYILCLALRN